MNFGLNDDQQMLRDTFARFFDTESSMERVRRASKANGVDRALWQGLAELGTFSMRVPETAGGLGMSTFDAAMVMEEAGRMLASGPLAEALVATRVLGLLDAADPLAQAMAGEKIVTFAFRDIAEEPVQWLAGGTAAELVVARNGDAVVLVTLADTDRRQEESLAQNGIAEVDLGNAPQTVLGEGDAALAIFAAAHEEWKLLAAAALTGLSLEAMRLASAYASERTAFGVPIGTFQGLAHPLANLACDVEGGKYFTWQVIHGIFAQDARAAAHVPLTLWWAAKTAGEVGVQTTRTFGGYGLSTEYDIHLYNLRAKAWPLIHGDPRHLLEEAGRRFYAGETATLPDVGTVSIDFDLGDEARKLADEVETFFAATLTPELQAHAHHSWDCHHPVVHKKLAEANLLYPAWPKDRGGRGVPPYAQYAALQVWEKYGWSNHAPATTQMIGFLIDRFGGEKVKKDVVAPILAGEIICSLGYSEPASGSDIFAAQTRATRDGDGWRIDGTKMFTSGADIADFVFMLCRTNNEVAKHKGLTLFVVPLKTEGVTIQPVHTFQDERTNITFYDNVWIPDEYRIGDVDGGIRVMGAALELEHGGAFAQAQATMIEAAETLCREIRYRGRPLIEDAGAQARLARAWTHCRLAEVLTLRALWSAETKTDVPAAGPMAKMFSSEKFLADGADLLDLTAPVSLSKRTGPAGAVNMAYRFAHGTTIWAGTSEVHRSLIAERVLGLPRSR